MIWNQSDRINYIKGMLILVCKDRMLTCYDEKIVSLMASNLGFNNFFVEDLIKEIKENCYIIEAPPVFSNKELADIFIKDAIHFAFQDHRLHLYELQWLSQIALANNLAGTQLFLEIKQFLTSDNSPGLNPFEIQKYCEAVLS